MKKGTFLLFAILSFQCSYAQWWNAYSEKTGLILSLHQTDSAFELYSPLQTSDPIPVSKWSLKNDTLHLECASIGFKATLTRNTTPLPPSERGDEDRSSSKKGDEDGDVHSLPFPLSEGGQITWTGTWRQGLMKESVTFRPTDTLFQLRRPQTPQPPYHFDEETITADYTDSHGNTVHLEGTLTVPRQPSSSSPKLGEGDRRSTAVEECVKFPTLLLVSGSGQQNRDEEIFQHKPFLVLADYLASRGIAVLRYDDRGVGASHCSPPDTGGVPRRGEGVSDGRACLDSADTYLFAEDAEAMFNVLKNNPHVDPNRLGIGGHSEGGAIAPMVAARNKDVKFVVMLAGQGCTGLEVLVQQNEAIFKANGLSERLVAVRTNCFRELFQLPEGSKKKDYQEVIDRHTASLSKQQLDSIGLGKGSAYQMKQQLDSRWMRTFLSLNPADYLPKVQCPILALQGAKDCQVVAVPNIEQITLLTGKNSHCEIFANLNHLFQHCTTGSPNEYMMIEETFAPEAMKAIADWILALP